MLAGSAAFAAGGGPAPVAKPKVGGLPWPVPNRLGQFFLEWGVRLDRRCVGGYCKPDSIRVYVNGKPYLGDPRQILLADRSEIAIVIGSLPKKIPSRFPASAIL